jgi:hypothetical protein
MLVYRIFTESAGAHPGEPGHHSYIPHMQTTGRWDNANEYGLIYLAQSPEGAVAEVFGELPQWGPTMFDVPHLGGRRALATFSMPDDLPILDLDDAQTLVEQHLRPTQVVIRNPAFTQTFALRAFREHTAAGERRYAGIRWWSFWRPQWAVLALWVQPGEPYPLQLQGIDQLTLDHAAVRDAAKALVRPRA